MTSSSRWSPQRTGEFPCNLNSVWNATVRSEGMNCDKQNYHRTVLEDGYQFPDRGDVNGALWRPSVCRRRNEWVRVVWGFWFPVSLCGHQNCCKLDCEVLAPHWLSSLCRLPSASSCLMCCCSGWPDLGDCSIHLHRPGCKSTVPAAEYILKKKKKESNRRLENCLEIVRTKMSTYRLDGGYFSFPVWWTWPAGFGWRYAGLARRT